MNFFPEFENTGRKLIPLLPQCGLCGLYKGCKTPKMPVAGKGKRKILVIGEAPGETEDDVGKPFVGPAGEILREALSKVNIDLDSDCWTTNAAICFTGDVSVQSLSRIRKIYRRKYSGTLVRVQTLAGRIVTGTPNHPALTSNGWVALSLLKKGDNLVCCDIRQGSKTDINNSPTRFDELFRFLSQFGYIQRMIGRSVNFHGDGEDGDVDVVMSNIFLRDDMKSTINKHESKLPLESSNTLLQTLSIFGSDDADSMNFLNRPFASSHSLVSSLSDTLPSVCPDSVHTHAHRITPFTQDNADSAENTLESTKRDAKRMSEWLQSLSGFVTMDHIVKIERQACNQLIDGDNTANGSTHVFNLETEDGYYMADGIVVSNCHPPKNKLPEKAVLFCQPNIVRTVTDLNPEIIIPLGPSAVKSLLGWLWRPEVGLITRWVGWRIPVQKNNCWVCPTWHPSYLLRSDPKGAEVLSLLFNRHIKAACKLRGRPWDRIHDYKSEVMVFMNPDLASEAIRSIIKQGKLTAWDLETDRRKPDRKESKIIACSMSNGTMTIAYPWCRETRKATQEFLKSPVPKIASNMKFETRWSMKEFGHGVRNWSWDTMLTAHVLDNRQGIASIEFQSFVLLGQPIWDEYVELYIKSKEEGGNEPNRLAEADLYKVLLYNGLDSLMEWHVAQIQMKRLMREVKGESKNFQ